MKDHVASTDELINALGVEKVAVNGIVRTFQISNGLERRALLQKSHGAIALFDRGTQQVRADKAVCSR